MKENLQKKISFAKLRLNNFKNFKKVPLDIKPKCNTIDQIDTANKKFNRSNRKSIKVPSSSNDSTNTNYVHAVVKQI